LREATKKRAAKDTQDALLLFKNDMGAYVRLYAFLSALPKGPVYAVELRNAELVTAAYGQALAAALARGRKPTVNPYGDGHAAERIVAGHREMLRSREE